MKTNRVLLAIACIFVLAAAAPQEIAERLAEGERLFNLGRFEEALAAFQEADRLAQGGSALSLLHLSRTYRRLQKVDLAVEHARRALPLAADPEAQAAAYTALGLALLDQPGAGAHLEEAEQAIRQAVGLSGNENSPLQPTLRRIVERRQKADEAAREKERQAAVSVAQERCLARDCACSEGSVAGHPEGPKVRRRTTPRYTRRAMAAGLRGVVLLEMVIDEKGKACCPRVTKGLPMGLDQAALDAVEHWKFEPARRGGKPVCVYYVATVEFSPQ